MGYKAKVKDTGAIDKARTRKEVAQPVHEPLSKEEQQKVAIKSALKADKVLSKSRNQDKNKNKDKNNNKDKDKVLKHSPREEGKSPEKKKTVLGKKFSGIRF